jgi:hypothetical protein
MLLTLVGLAALSVASAFWLRIWGFTMMMSVIIIAFVLVVSNEFASFGRVAAYTLLALLVMQVAYFVGILLRLLLSYRNKDEAGAASKNAMTDKPTSEPQKRPDIDRTRFRTSSQFRRLADRLPRGSLFKTQADTSHNFLGHQVLVPSPTASLATCIIA